MGLNDYWLLLGVVLIASLIQGTSGFGFGLFSMGVLAMLMPVSEAAVLVAVLGLFSTMVNLWTVRHAVPWREAWPVIAVAVPLTLVGVLLLKSLNDRILRIAVAVAILAGCAVALWSPKRARISRTWPWGYLAGAVGGVFGGALNMGGPPVVLYTLFRGWEKDVAKGLMSAFFFSTSIARLAGQAGAGIATWPLVQLSLYLVIPTLLASWVGTRVFSRMSTRTFRYAATAILVGLAVKLLVPG